MFGLKKRKRESREVKEIKRIMIQEGISQETMARMLGVSIRTLWRWIHRTGKPSNMGMEKMRDFLRKRG